MDTQISFEEVIKLLEDGFNPETIAFEFDLSEEYVNESVWKHFKNKVKIAKKEQDWEEVERLLKRRLEDEPEDLIAMADMANALKKQGKWQEVESLQRKRLELEPENKEAMADLANALKRQGKWQEVESLQRKRLELEPANKGTMADIAISLKRQGKWQELEILQRERLELNSDDVIVMADLAIALKKQGKWQELESLQKRLLELNPENVIGMVDLALALKQQRKWQELESLQRKILKLNPEDVIAMSDLALALKIQGKWEELEVVLKRRLEIEPDNLETKRHLEVATKKLQRKKARKHFETRKGEKIIPRSDKNEIKHRLLSQDKQATDCISKYRQEIKTGAITVERANKIIEELKQTGGVKANILIAEIQARVMGQPLLSARFLQSCKKSATTEAEKKAYSRAIEIVNQKRTVVLSKLEDIDGR